MAAVSFGGCILPLNFAGQMGDTRCCLGMVEKGSCRSDTDRDNHVDSTSDGCSTEMDWTERWLEAANYAESNQSLH
eukprot:scaffold1850_cov164-Alexandrium_tamarense.AAC.7